MTIKLISLDLIDDNPFQPRSSYPTTKIEELAHSIQEIGLRQKPEARQVDGRYQLAYGHLRKRAFKKLLNAKLKDMCPETAAYIKDKVMPLDVKELTDKQMVHYALEENLRRQDITPMDLARSVDLYLTKFEDETETSLAKILNMTQGNVANMRRVLKLPTKVVEKVDEGKINFTMARELLIFQGLNAGNTRVWSRQEHREVNEPKDEDYLMLSAIKGVGGQYGPPATVDGIKKSIYSVLSSNFYSCEYIGGYYSRESPLFDIETAGCAKCEFMVKGYETKSQTRKFCTDPKCWEQHQADHKKKQAAAAKKKMEDDITKRLAAETAVRQGAPAAAVPAAAPISQEIPRGPKREDEEENDLGPEEELIETMNRGEEEDEVTPPADAPRFDTLEAVCQGCINKKACDGTKRMPMGKQYACRDRLTKDGQVALRKKVTVELPASLKQLVTDKAGSRAEILDTRDLRLGMYGGELKTGYVMIKGAYDSGLEKMADPEECTERCTKGFHYAFDSGDHEAGRIYFICTNPKCVAQKKAAFTRAKNAEGTAKKKAEMKAIKEAADATTELDLPRLRLVFFCQLNGRQVQHYYGSHEDTADWLLHKLGATAKNDSNKGAAAWKALETKLATNTTEADKVKYLRMLLVEFMLSMLTYEGDAQHYKVQTQEVLSWMHIPIKVERPEPEKKGTKPTKEKGGPVPPTPVKKFAKIEAQLAATAGESEREDEEVLEELTAGKGDDE